MFDLIGFIFILKISAYHCDHINSLSGHVQAKLSQIKLFLGDQTRNCEYLFAFFSKLYIDI